MRRRSPKRPRKNLRQLELPFGELSPKVEPAKAVAPQGLRLIQGGGESKQERLDSREAVVHVLLEAGVDLLLRRISAERAEEIESRVDRILSLFDQTGSTGEIEENQARLRMELDDLERLMTETRALRTPRRRSV